MRKIYLFLAMLLAAGGSQVEAQTTITGSLTTFEKSTAAGVSDLYGNSYIAKNFSRGRYMYVDGTTVKTTDAPASASLFTVVKPATDTGNTTCYLKTTIDGTDYYIQDYDGTLATSEKLLYTGMNETKGFYFKTEEANAGGINDHGGYLGSWGYTDNGSTWVFGTTNVAEGTLNVSDDTNEYWYTIKNVRATASGWSKLYAYSGGSGQNVGISGSVANTKYYWKIVSGDTGYKIVNYDGSEIVNSSAGAFKTAANGDKFTITFTTNNYTGWKMTDNTVTGVISSNSSSSNVFNYDDEGSIWNLEPVDVNDANILALADLLETIKKILPNVGTLGYATDEEGALAAAYNSANAVYNDGNCTDANAATAYAALDAAYTTYKAGAIVMPEDGKYYTLTNKKTSYIPYDDYTLSVTDGSGTIFSATSATSKSFWKVSASGADYSLQGQTGRYMNVVDQPRMSMSENSYELQVPVEGAFYFDGLHSNTSYVTNGNVFVVQWTFLDAEGSQWTFTAVDESLYDIYDVVIVNGEADSYVTYAGAGNTDGNASVYNGGAYFLTPGTTVAAADFTPSAKENYEPTVTISGKTITITYEADIDALLAEANALASNVGKVGYPKSDADATAQLNTAIATPTVEDLIDAIAAFKASTEIMLPEDGHAYRIHSDNRNDATFYIGVNGTSISLSSTPAANSDVWVCQKVGENYVFANAVGNYYMGFKDETSGTAYNWTIDGTQNNIGCLAMKGVDATKYMLVANAGTFDQANTTFDKDATNFSSDFIFEDVTTAEGHFATTISSVGYSTLYLPYTVTVPEGVNAYAPTVSGDQMVFGTALTTIPSETAVILEGTAGNYTFNSAPYEASASSALSGNLISAPVEASTVHTLQRINGTTGFYVFSGTTLAANKAYLGNTSPAKAFIFGTATGIENIDATLENGKDVYFDLSGRRVSKPTKGIYIKNGKKIIFK